MKTITLIILALFLTSCTTASRVAKEDGAKPMCEVSGSKLKRRC